MVVKFDSEAASEFQSSLPASPASPSTIFDEEDLLILALLNAEP